MKIFFEKESSGLVRELGQIQLRQSTKINLSMGVLGIIILEEYLFTFYDVQVKDISCIPFTVSDPIYMS